MVHINTFRSNVNRNCKKILDGNLENYPINDYPDDESLSKKLNFNDQVVSHVMPIYWKFRNHNRKIDLHVMDAKHARTTRILLKNKVSPKRITTFTYNLDDYTQINELNLGVGTIRIMAEDYYMDPKFRIGAHIIIDDGMQAGGKTLSRAKALMIRGIEYAAIMFNVTLSRRDSSHNYFERELKLHALEFKYQITIKALTPYRQTNASLIMYPFWVEIKKEKTIR
jgi:hypothetical protein